MEMPPMERELRGTEEVTIRIEKMGKEHEIAMERVQEKLKISKGDDSQVLHVNSKDEGRWKILARSRGAKNNGNSKNIGANSMRSRRFSEDAKGSESYMALRLGRLKELDGHQNDTSSRKKHEPNQENRELETSSKLKQGEGMVNDNHLMLGDREEGAASNDQRTKLDGEGKSENNSGDTEKTMLDEFSQTKTEEASNIQKQVDRVNKVDSNDKRKEAAEGQEGLEIADIRESETDLFKESNLTSEENKDKSEEQRDESNF
ncbi:DEK domain-containing chromatin-associated protein 4-like [Malania oleifera]|uniref:DEK domain-containing chromatin-associated protein 4-like n=1 Tax=Malania oleifera TaxID=397392 RepID=UPI0025AE35C0|nr:DEK domain-containing chromatin-associated protein 4-like [Malania oleifera]